MMDLMNNILIDYILMLEFIPLDLIMFQKIYNSIFRRNTRHDSTAFQPTLPSDFFGGLLHVTEVPQRHCQYHVHIAVAGGFIQPYRYLIYYYLLVDKIPKLQIDVELHFV